VHQDDGAPQSPGHRDGEAPVGARARDRVMAAGAAAALCVAAYAWWAVGLAPFSAAATTAVVLAGTASVAVGARERRRRAPLRPSAVDPADKPGAARWAVLAAVAGAWQLAAYLQQPRDDHPTASSMANGVLDSHPARAVAFVVWIAAARELARR
jgi:uncharacterized membrane protein